MSDPEALRLSTPGWSNPDLPVLVWRGRVPIGDLDAIETTLAGHNWRPDWRNGVYSFHHYHSTAHEALACTDGSATLTLGGPDGMRLTIAAGDLLVLPAGTGHCRKQASTDFLLIGAYPDGQSWDLCREPADREALSRISAVTVPTDDPLDGAAGALRNRWRRA